MTPKQALNDLAKARVLKGRAQLNYERWARSIGLQATAALERADRQSDEADALLDGVAAFLLALSQEPAQ